MAVERGIHQVVCRECDAPGEVLVGSTSRNGKASVEDRIAHVEGCSLLKREQPRHLKKKGWVPQEKRANALVGARETLASGAVGLDGDGRAFHEWRVESKRTREERYLLRQDTWTKLLRGMRSGEEPLLHIEFLGKHGWKDRRVVIRRATFDAMALPGTELHEAPWAKNAKSFRLDVGNYTPLLVELEPPGVMVNEAVFERLKERL